MENLRLQLSGVSGPGQASSFSLADQLGGPSMDLQALNLKIGLVQRNDIEVGIAAALLRVFSDQGKRAAELMKA